MAKSRNREWMPAIGSVFCFFIVFLRCLGLLSSFSLGGLLLPALWLLLGLCLLTGKKNWLCVVGMLPLVILTVQSAWSPLPTGDLTNFFQTLVDRVLPAAGYVLAWIFLLLACCGNGGKFCKGFWILPVLMILPGCVLQYGSAMAWAELGVIACLCYWTKPRGE